MFCSLCWLRLFFMLELTRSWKPSRNTAIQNPVFPAMIHQRWPPFHFPTRVWLGVVIQILYPVEQILQVSSLDPTFYGSIFPFLLCEIPPPPPSLCARVQLATAGELIITSIVIIIISLSPLLERLPVCAAAALIAGAGTNCPFYIQKHYLVHFHSTKNTHSRQTDTVNINHVLCWKHLHSNLTLTAHLKKKSGIPPNFLDIWK